MANVGITKMNVYLASPLGFSEAGRGYYYSVLIPAIRDAGCNVLDPWGQGDHRQIDVLTRMPPGEDKQRAWRELNQVIGANNVAAIDRAVAVVAVLDGPDVDSGTAAEIGYAFAKGKLIIGYRGDFRLAGDNEGSAVNVQVEYFIRASGGPILGSVKDIAQFLRHHVSQRTP